MNSNLSNHARSLPSDVQKRFTEKIGFINSSDPYTLLNDPSLCWTTDLSAVPDLMYPDIFNYLVLSKNVYTCEEFKAFKSLEAFNFFC